jgi:CheY-like chemotaxis protein
MASQHDAHRHQVMVVDDYDDLLDALAFLLECEGYVVWRAHSGAEALAALKAGYRPCLMLLDASMPDMDGLEVRARMAADPALAGISIVDLSGMDRIVRAAHHGVPAVLAKPVEADDLFAAVRRYARCQSAAPPGPSQ